MGVVFGTTLLAGLLGKIFYGRLQKKNTPKDHTRQPAKSIPSNAEPKNDPEKKG